jgi:hypothetical protein
MQLKIAGEAYNRFHQLVLELQGLHTFDEAGIAGRPGTKPNIYLLLHHDLIPAIKAEIHELLIAMGDQNWAKYENKLDAVLDEQLKKGSRLLNVPAPRKGENNQELVITKLLGVLQHEAQLLDNNTATDTLKETKKIVKNICTIMMSNYF